MRPGLACALSLGYTPSLKKVLNSKCYYRNTIKGHLGVGKTQGPCPLPCSQGGACETGCCTYRCGTGLSVVLLLASSTRSTLVVLSSSSDLWAFGSTVGTVCVVIRPQAAWCRAGEGRCPLSAALRWLAVLWGPPVGGLGSSLPAAGGTFPSVLISMGHYSHTNCGSLIRDVSGQPRPLNLPSLSRSLRPLARSPDHLVPVVVN